MRLSKVLPDLFTSPNKGLFMNSRSNSSARQLEVLRQHYFPIADQNPAVAPPVVGDIDDSHGVFNRLVRNAGFLISGRTLFYASIVSSLALSGLFFSVHYTLAPFFFIVGFYLPIYYCLECSKRRAARFATELPPMLLATASNMKAGLTVYSSLERATLLLPEDSEARKEVVQFLARITNGVPKDKAVRMFASDIELPELDLFRRAFVLVITHGGRFSRTLERLARISRDRENLIRAAQVSTASMRMTANILMVLAPLVVALVSLRTENYFGLMYTHSVAFLLASIGVITILGSVFSLRKMSDFKP